MTEMLVSGTDLKLERIARHVKQGELAARMGVSPSRLSNLEARAVVNADKALAYRRALATFPAVATPSEPASAA